MHGQNHIKSSYDFSPCCLRLARCK